MSASSFLRLSGPGLLLAALGCTPPPIERVCKGFLAGDLVLTELMTDPEGADTGQEYLELFNATGQALELGGLTLYTTRVDRSAESSHLIRSGVVPSKGYFVLGDAREQPYPPYLGYSYGDALPLTNSSGLVGLRCGSLVIDEVIYTSSSGAGRAHSLDGKLVPDSAMNDQEQHWCDAAASPGAANAPCTGMPGSCADPQSGSLRAVVSPAAGELVLTEVMADPAAVADSEGEWFEVLARADVDLNGLELYGGSNGSTLQSASCLRVATGSYSVFAREADAGANGGLGEVLGRFTFGLTNSGGTLGLRVADAGIDEIRYGPAQLGVAAQLNPARLDAVSNDEPASFCPATQVYGAGDKGTPGAANSACSVLPEPNECLDALSGVSRPVVSPAPGEVVITEFMADPKAVGDTAGEWFEVLVNAEVDLNGIELANEDAGTRVVSQSCIRPGTGNLVLFARNGDPQVNGGLPDQVVATFGFSLANSGARAIALRLDGGVLDQITYSRSTSGVSTQLSASKLDALSNDDPANFCLTGTGRTYGGSPDGGPDGGPLVGDRGTPGALNETCP